MQQIVKGICYTIIAIWMFLVLVVLLGLLGEISRQNDYLIPAKYDYSTWQSNWPVIPKCDKPLEVRVEDGC